MAPAPPTRVIIRKMRPRPPPPSPPRVSRTAGHKLGLTRDQILEAAKRTLTVRLGSVSVKAVAADLGVAHNSIGARLKREGTTLERELAKDLLSRISRPMRPSEDWRSRLGSLFEDAADECRTHPGLAQVVIAWLGQGQYLCADFTEQTLYLLAVAGLSTPDAEASLDMVAAALCGGLAVQFPNFGLLSPAEWAKSAALAMEKLPAHRYPLTHSSRLSLSAVATEKMSTTQSTGHGRVGAAPHDFAQSLVTFIEAKRPPPARG